MSPRLERAKDGMVGESDRLLRVMFMSHVLQEMRHALPHACETQTSQKALDVSEASFYECGAPSRLSPHVAQKAEKALNSLRAINYLFREMPSASSAKRKRSRNENKKTAKEETQRV